MKKIVLLLLLSAISLFVGCSTTINVGTSKNDTAKPVKSNTLILQPSNNPNEIRISSLHGTASAPCIPLVAWTWSGDEGISRTLLKFDLSELKSTAKIKQATLSLYSDSNISCNGVIPLNSGEDNGFYIQQVTAPWLPSTVTWANQPFTTTENQVHIPHSLQVLNIAAIDVTEMIKDMVANGKNYGFLLRLTNEVCYTSKYFHGSWYKDLSKHPCLTIIYE